MALFLTIHAFEAMERRKISRAEVLEALGNRETVYVSADDRSRLVVLGRTEAGRALKVVVERDDEECIITVAGRQEEG